MLTDMNKVRSWKNLIALSIGFFFLFTAFQALSNLQSTMNDNHHIGITSQIIIYVTFSLSALFTPKLFIKQFDCKWTLVMSIAGYVPYIAANFYPTPSTFFTTAFLVGFCAAPLWAAQSTYITQIASQYAFLTKETDEVITSRFFGIFYFFFQNTQIWGNLISFLILKHKEEDISSEIVDLSICGAQFCDENFNRTNSNLIPPTYDQRYMLIGIYTVCGIIAVIIVATFLDPLYKKGSVKEKIMICEKLFATFKQMKIFDQFLLIPLTIYIGVAHAFILSDYTKAYIACTWGIYHVGYVFMCYGVANCIMSLLLGKLLKYVTRLSIFCTIAILQFVAFLWMFYWKPTPDQFYIFFIFIGIMGICDAVWRIQVTAYYGLLFTTEIEASYSNFHLWESIGFLLSFVCSTTLCMAPKFFISFSFLILGMIGYVTTEMRFRSSTKKHKLNM